VDLEAKLEELSAKLKETALGPQLQGPHAEKGTLYYHYTTAEGLCGILNSRDLWATNAFYLNDPLETEYGQNFCDRFLARETKERPNSHFVTFLDGCWKTMRWLSEDIFPHELQFITSFSLKGDMLGQWRAYSDSGKGFCLGFANDELMTMLGDMYGERDVATVPRPLPMKVVYTKTEQEKILAKVLAVIEDEWPLLEEPFLNNDDANARLKLLGAYWLATACSCFKNEAFAHEDEVRVLYSNIREMKTAKTVLEVNLRSRNGLIVPFRRLGLYHKARLPIRKIIVGPLLNFERAKLALTMYFQGKGYGEHEMPAIEKSEVRLQF
jgi:hypothetical protein